MDYKQLEEKSIELVNLVTRMLSISHSSAEWKIKESLVFVLKNRFDELVEELDLQFGYNEPYDATTEEVVRSFTDAAVSLSEQVRDALNLR